MVSSIDKLNMFSASSGFAPISSTQAVGTGTSTAGVRGGNSSGNSFSGSNLFEGNTVGINNGVTGTAVFASAQAGKSDAVLGKQFQAIS